MQTGQDGEDRQATFAFAMHARDLGVRFGLWSRPPDTAQAVAAIRDLDATFYVANVESPEDLAAFDPRGFRTRYPLLETAVCTHFGGFEYDRHLAAPYIANGFTIQTECYLNENANATPAALDSRARGLGWPGSCALLGVYEGALGRRSLASYRDVVAPHPWGIYLLETMTPDDWAELARWTAR